MKTSRFNFHRQGFALLEVSIALILTAGLTLYYLHQLQHQTALDKVAAFAEEYVVVHKAAERYVNKYKIALQKITGNCQSARSVTPEYISFFHVDRSPTGTSAGTANDQDCRLRDPATMALVTGIDGQAIGNAFNVSVADLINLGLLPESTRNSGQILPSATTTLERRCAAHTQTTYDEVPCAEASSVEATPGLFLQIQMLCNGIPLDVAQGVVKTTRVPALCTGNLLFRTIVYNKQPLPKLLPSLNLTRTEVLFKAAQSAGGNAVMSLDNSLAPHNGTDGLLYNSTRTFSIDNPILRGFRLTRDPLIFIMENAEGIFAVYGDYPQPNAVKQTPFASCNPAIDLTSLPNSNARKTVGLLTIAADLATSFMVCGTTSVTGFCTESGATTCWIPLKRVPPDDEIHQYSGGRDTPGYPLGYYDFFFNADLQDRTYP